MCQMTDLDYKKSRISNIIDRWHLLAINSCDTRSKVLINAKRLFYFYFSVLISYLVTTYINDLICFLWLCTYFLFVLNQYPIKLQYEVFIIEPCFLTSMLATLLLIAALLIIAAITSNLQSVK